MCITHIKWNQRLAGACGELVAVFMNWDDLRILLSLSRTGSLTRSAATLRVSISTIGRRLDALEKALGITLITRHSTGVLLTDQGKDLLARAERVEAEVIALERNAAGLDAQPSGVVRIATAETLASHILIPALAGFRERYPAITLEIVTGIGTVGLSRREADLALRLVRPTGQELICRRLGSQAYGLYAAEDYLRRHPWDENERFADHALIGWDETLAHLPMARWLREESAGRRAALSLTSVPTHLAAVRAALGLAVLPCFVGDRTPGLKRLMPPQTVFSEDLWLIIHPDLAQSARIRVVADFISETVLGARNAFEGNA
jgi:DNA-binding transcriptional LysR family regulator